MAVKKLKPIHPAEVLLEEFLKPMDLSQNRVALAIGVPPRRINENRPWQAQPDRGYGFAVGPLLRRLRTILARATNGLRSGRGCR
jgi:hypothetical protein